MRELFNIDLNDFPAIIAEIGLNHEGSLDKAKKLIKLAKKGNADAVKFQFYTPDKYVSTSNQNRYNQVSKFSLSVEDFFELKNFSKKLKIPFFATPLTEDWVEIIANNCEVVKVASGDINFYPTLKLVTKFAKKIIVSTGASSFDEIKNTVKFVKQRRKNYKDTLALLHCISSYPTPSNEVNLESINFLKEKFNLSIGYSNHNKDIKSCLYAFIKGAKIIEVHFTDSNRKRKFRDHQLSFTWKQIKQLRNLMNEAKVFLGSYEKKIQKSEKDNQKIIRKGIIVKKDLEKNSQIKSSDLSFARPATEMCYKEARKIVGKKLKKKIVKGFQLSICDLKK